MVVLAIKAVPKRPHSGRLPALQYESIKRTHTHTTNETTFKIIIFNHFHFL